MRGTCVAAGEIDLATVQEFSSAMRDTIDRGTGTIFVDCSAVTFMDSTAFHALVAAQKYARGRALQLTIRELQPGCARLLDLCDWDHVLAIQS